MRAGAAAGVQAAAGVKKKVFGWKWKLGSQRSGRVRRAHHYNELLPIPGDRNGRHWMRVELSTILMKFAFKISVQLWSRRENSVVPTA